MDEIVDTVATPVLVYPQAGDAWWESVLTFLSSVIGSTAWPLALLILVLVFRKQIATILDKIKSVKWGDVEAVIERDIQEATTTASAIEPAPADIADENKGRFLELTKMARSSPTGAIVEAWKDIEEAGRDLAESSGIAVSSVPSRPYFSLQALLAGNKLIPRAEVETFRELRMIRNRAAHIKDDQVTVDQARQYVVLADRLVDALKAIKWAREADGDQGGQ